MQRPRGHLFGVIQYAYIPASIKCNLCVLLEKYFITGRPCLFLLYLIKQDERKMKRNIQCTVRESCSRPSLEPRINTVHVSMCHIYPLQHSFTIICFNRPIRNHITLIAVYCHIKFPILLWHSNDTDE